MQPLCQRSNLRCLDHFPSVEPKISPAAGITLFRIGQEVLFVAEAQPGVKVVEFHVTVSDTQQPAKCGRARNIGYRGLAVTRGSPLAATETMALIIEVPLMSIQCPSPAKE